jgi:hypothetical protein
MVHPGDAIMSYNALTLIGDMMFSLVGNGMLMTLLFCGVIVLFLAVAKISNPAVYISVLVPFLIGLYANSKTTNAVSVAGWIIFPVLIVFAIFLGIWLIHVFTNE